MRTFILRWYLHFWNRPRRDRGQTTAEYALVLLAAATLALLVVAWATQSGKVGELFDAVFDRVMGDVA